MTSTVVSIADDVKQLIASNVASERLRISDPTDPGDWVADDTVARSYMPEYDLSDMAHIRCSVIPATLESVTLNRAGKRRETYGVDVVLQTRPDDNDAMDAMMDMVEEIDDCLKYRTLSGTGAVWVGVERNPLFQAAHIDQAQMFSAGSRHSFRLIS